MTDDHLDKETSLSAEMTESGLRAAAKSRGVSGLDRLLGNITEFFNVPMEERSAIRRERLNAEISIMRASAETIARQVAVDPEFAMRAMGGNILQHFRKQENKEDVARRTVDQLRLSPPSEAQQQTGPDDLSPEFLNAFERHAEDASTETARDKWARVLASEIKMPGTFNKKTMRILDEIDNEVASAFAEMSKCRIHDCIPMCLHSPSFIMSGLFTEHDLINNTYPNTIRQGVAIDFSDGIKRFILAFNPLAIALEPDDDLQNKIEKASKTKLIVWDYEENLPSVPIILATPSGRSIFELMEDKSLTNARHLIAELGNNDIKAKLMTIGPNGNLFYAD